VAKAQGMNFNKIGQIKKAIQVYCQSFITDVMVSEWVVTKPRLLIGVTVMVATTLFGIHYFTRSL
jgi:hypothetical protein